MQPAGVSLVATVSFDTSGARPSSATAVKHEGASATGCAHAPHACVLWSVITICLRVVHGHSSSPEYDALGGASERLGSGPCGLRLPSAGRVLIIIGCIEKACGDSTSIAKPDAVPCHDLRYSPPLPSTRKAESGSCPPGGSSTPGGSSRLGAPVGTPGTERTSHCGRMPPCDGALLLPAGPTCTILAALPVR